MRLPADLDAAAFGRGGRIAIGGRGKSMPLASLMKTTRLAVINLIPAPYREALYQALSRTPGMTLRVLYLQSRDSLRNWSMPACSYDAVRLRCLTPESLYAVPVVGVLNPGLIRNLQLFSPDCLLVHGYSYLPQMQAMRWAIRHQVPYLLLGDSNSRSLAAEGLRAAAKAACLRYFCRCAAGVLTIGSSNEEFWSYYGVEPARQFRSPLAIDNAHFSAQSALWRERREEQRQKLGLPSDRLLLFVGRFAPEKNLPALLRGLAAAGRGVTNLSLAMVGDGPEKAGLQRLVQKLGLRNVYQFGIRPQAELPMFYGIADALVLASRCEPWGLVVNEAMACGLPVLLAQSAGCRPDLLDQGRNGLSFDETDPVSIASCLTAFSRLPAAQLHDMGAHSAQLIGRWTHDASLAGLLRGVEAAMAARSGATSAGAARAYANRY